MFLRKIKDYFYLAILGKKPVLVYAPGRVGSMGLIKNLRKAGIFCFKVEFFETEKRTATRLVKKLILNTNRPANFITLVRDPMDIMVSYYLSKCTKGWIKDGQNALHTKDIASLRKIFITGVLQTKRLDDHLYWFENDFEKYLKVSVAEIPFNQETKTGRLDTDRYNILILRTELNDAEKAKQINNFLGTSEIVITRENQAQNKPYAEIYKDFKAGLTIPGDILNKIYTAPYVTHFFSSSEIKELKEKWSSHDR